MKFVTFLILALVISAEGWTSTRQICNRPMFSSSSCPLYSRNIQASSDKTSVDEREALISQINELASAFEQVQETIQANAKLYEQKMDDYEEDIEKLKVEIDKQIVGIMTRDNDIKELKARLAKAKSTSQQTGEIEILQEEKNSLLIDNEELNKEIQLKDEKIEALLASLAIKETDIVTKANEIVKLRDLLEKAHDEKNTMQTSMDEYQIEKSYIMERLQKLEDQKRLLKDDLEAAKSQICARDDEIENLNGTVSKLQTDLDTVATERDAVRIELGKTEERLHERESAWIEEKMGILADMKKSLEEVQDNARKEKEMLSKENSFLLVKLDEAQSQFSEIDDRYKRMVKDIEDRLNDADQDDIKLRKEIIDIRAKSYKEKMDMRRKMEINDKMLGDQIHELKHRLQQYELDRRSLRKLSLWALSRLGSVLTFGRKRG